MPFTPNSLIPSLPKKTVFVKKTQLRDQQSQRK